MMSATIVLWAVGFGVACSTNDPTGGGTGGGTDDGGGSDGGTPDDDLDDGGVSGDSAVVGPEGGTFTLSGVVLEVPAGALDADTELTVQVDPEGAPAEYVAYSDVYDFGPDGLTFSLPIRVGIPTASETET